MCNCHNSIFNELYDLVFYLFLVAHGLRHHWRFWFVSHNQFTVGHWRSSSRICAWQEWSAPKQGFYGSYAIHSVIVGEWYGCWISCNSCSSNSYHASLEGWCPFPFQMWKYEMIAYGLWISFSFSNFLFYLLCLSLQAMVSGAIGGFLDVAFNFNSQAYSDDNLLG